MNESKFENKSVKLNERKKYFWGEETKKMKEKRLKKKNKEGNWKRKKDEK